MRATLPTTSFAIQCSAARIAHPVLFAPPAVFPKPPQPSRKGAAVEHRLGWRKAWPAALRSYSAREPKGVERAKNLSGYPLRRCRHAAVAAFAREFSETAAPPHS